MGIRRENFDDFSLIFEYVILGLFFKFLYGCMCMYVFGLGCVEGIYLGSIEICKGEM